MKRFATILSLALAFFVCAPDTFAATKKTKKSSPAPKPARQAEPEEVVTP